MESNNTVVTTADEPLTTGDTKLPKNCKENRYYYRHREKILERQRLARLKKRGVDITQVENTQQSSLEERRKMKMKLLGVTESK